jgi:DNA-binding winged helix-turn-helix (wHTH) protein
MAKPKTNKSAAVREILGKDRNTPTKEIIATLAQRGIKVHPHLVYIIKSKMRAKRGRQKRERALENGRQMGIANPVDLILEVRQLSEKAGGLKHLKKLVDVLAE